MKTLKEYIFANIDNEGMSLTIFAKNIEEAYELLVSIVKHPADFKCVS